MNKTVLSFQHVLILPFLPFSDLHTKRKRTELGQFGDVDWPAAVPLVAFGGKEISGTAAAGAVLG